MKYKKIPGFIEKTDQKPRSTSPPKKVLTQLGNNSIAHLKNLANNSVSIRQEYKVDEKPSSTENKNKAANSMEIDNMKSRLADILKTEIEDIPVAQISHSRILLEIVEYITAWDIDLF